MRRPPTKRRPGRAPTGDGGRKDRPPPPTPIPDSRVGGPPMLPIGALLQLVAVVCFGLAIVGTPMKVNPVALGLFCLALRGLLGVMPRHFRGRVAARPGPAPPARRPFHHRSLRRSAGGVSHLASTLIADHETPRLEPLRPSTALYRLEQATTSGDRSGAPVRRSPRTRPPQRLDRGLLAVVRSRIFSRENHGP